MLGSSLTSGLTTSWLLGAISIGGLMLPDLFPVSTRLAVEGGLIEKFGALVQSLTDFVGPTQLDQTVQSTDGRLGLAFHTADLAGKRSELLGQRESLDGGTRIPQRDPTM